MTCALLKATLIAFLGHIPAPGSEIIVPRAVVDQYTAKEQDRAKRCAERYGIRLKILEAAP